MELEQFDRVYDNLTERRKAVLTLFLSGKEDAHIAESLHITKNTVRQHIRNLCIEFGLTDDLDSSKTSQRHKLMRLFATYKPELVAPETAEAEDREELERDEETTSNPNFVGREQAIMDIDNLVRQGARCICILSPGGVGKTVLAERYLQQRFQTIVRFDIAKERQNVSSAESLVEEKLRSLGEEPGREFGVSLIRLHAKLESEKIGVLVDNLEPALGEGGRFIENHRSYVELLRVLCGLSVRSLTLITSRENVAENLEIEVYPLARLSLDAWTEYFQQNAMVTDSPILGEIHRAYQGNALAMKILRSRITKDYDNDIADYWISNHTQEGVVVEQAIDNLIIEQFNRLQTISTIAYQLLYRMGCLCFQDVPTVPREGLLCLLWDVPKNEGVKAIRDLCDRSLVERVNREYKLHPLIRQEAVKRLQKSNDWEPANRTAAEFWTDSVQSVETVEDAQQAIEACHHYISINDFDLASQVICKERDNQFEKAEFFGVACYRLGLLQKASNYIWKIIDNIAPSYALVCCYSILGDIEWLKGNLHKSIDCHDKGEEIAFCVFEQTKISKKESIICNRIIFISKFNRGLCYLDLFDFEKAYQSILDSLNYHDNFVNQGDSALKGIPSKFLSDRAKLMVMLAFIESHQGNFKETIEYLRNFDKSNLKGGAWSYGYGLLYLGDCYKQLKENQISINIYNHVLDFAEKINFLQFKGKLLTRLAELYRIENKFTTAFSYHAQSTEILEKLDAKCDLGEAYYQLGLTYKETGDIDWSQDYFERAIALWEKINAPKQIARVRESMNS